LLHCTKRLEQFNGIVVGLETYFFVVVKPVVVVFPRNMEKILDERQKT